MSMKFFSRALLFILSPFFCFAQLQTWTTNQIANGGSTNGTVVDFERHNWGDLYATGFFSQIDGQNADYVAKYDGTNWTEIGGGLADAGHAIKYIDSTYFVARYEFDIDSNWVHYLENNTWKNLGDGFYLTGANLSQFYTCNIFDVLKWNGQLVVCGEFDRNGSDTIFGIAAWDGQTWNPLGDGLSVPMFGQTINPHQLFEWDGDLLVCGNFIVAGSDTVNGIARWDGTSWSAFNEGFNNTVYAIGEFGGELYAAGAFTMSGSDTLLRIAKWDGNSWIDPGFGLDLSNPNGFCWVHTLYPSQDTTFSPQFVIGGGFDQVHQTGGSTLAAGNIVAFANNSIDVMNGGVNGEVEAIYNWEAGIAAGGIFSASNTPTPLLLPSLAHYTQYVVGLENELEEGLIVFPNPAVNKVEIQLPEGEQLSYWKLLDSFGKVVIDGSDHNIPFMDLFPGVYHLKAESDLRSFSQTIIKN